MDIGVNQDYPRAHSQIKHTSKGVAGRKVDEKHARMYEGLGVSET